MNWKSFARMCLSFVAGLAIAVGMTAAAPVNISICGQLHFCKPIDGFAPVPPVDTNAGLKPSMFKSQGRTHYYQLPQGDSKGTLVVLPGCARWGPGFWPYDAKGCTTCAGLTEDVGHTKQALARGYAIFVPWPIDRAYPGQYCWGKDDFPTLPKIIGDFLQQNKLDKKPVYLMGASSGGSVALKLQGALEGAKMPFKFSGVLALVSTNLEVGAFAPRQKHHPPIAWVSMSYPNEIKKAKTNVAEYKKYGPAATVIAGVKPVTPTYFADRHPQITPAQSADIVAGLKSIKLLGPDGIFLVDLKDKKQKGWPPKLYAAVPWLKKSPVYALGPVKKSAIQQAMLVAQAGHEHVCDYLTASLMWFESQGKANFEDLAVKYQVVKPSKLTMARYTGEPSPAEAFASRGGGFGAASRLLTEVETEAPDVLTTQTTDEDVTTREDL